MSLYWVAKLDVEKRLKYLNIFWKITSRLEGDEQKLFARNRGESVLLGSLIIDYVRLYSTGIFRTSKKEIDTSFAKFLYWLISVIVLVEKMRYFNRKIFVPFYCVCFGLA